MCHCIVTNENIKHSSGCGPVYQIQENVINSRFDEVNNSNRIWLVSNLIEPKQNLIKL